MYIACEKCKYNYDGECIFDSQGSGEEEDMPCYREKELIKTAVDNLLQAFVGAESNEITNEEARAHMDMLIAHKDKALEQQPCENINEDYDDCDQFKCSECQIELQDWHRVERDDDDGDITYHEYEFRYCPNCGRRVKRNEADN